MSTFDILNDDNRWLDALRSDGTVARLSLRELLTKAHEISRLSEASPLTEVALLRFLIALVSDGLREHVRGEQDWTRFLENCRDGLSARAVSLVISPLEGRSDVLDSSRDGFFDAPAIRRIPGWRDPKARQPVSRLLPELPTGTNLAHFAHTLSEASALCVGCLLKSRAIDAAFARGGLGPSLSPNLLATVAGIEPRYVVPVGDTLLRTLLLNAMVGDESRPSWVSIHRRKDGLPGPIARMTWRPRLVTPVADSEIDVPCARCRSIALPRFAQALMVDTYNYKNSPFGSKSDVDGWKKSTADPHVLPFDKTAVGLGSNPAEWPLRATTRLLAGGATTLFDRLPDRAAAVRCPLTVSVTSSAGNQAKIDDAPHAAAKLPLALLTRSPKDRKKIAVALAEIFSKRYRERREDLIPDAVPRLLSDIAVAKEPETTVAAWLQSGKGSVRIAGESISSQQSLDADKDAEPSNDGPLWQAAKRITHRLSRLSPSELAALRPAGRGGGGDVAARQCAFEAVWHTQSLPSGSRRHSLREALATVAPIYAVHPGRHRFSGTRGSFEEQLRRRVSTERISSGRPIMHASLRQLVASVTNATPASRDGLLMLLVDTLLTRGPNQQLGSIDFVDLLLEVACWNDPADPTPTRWSRLLQPAGSVTG